MEGLAHLIIAVLVPVMPISGAEIPPLQTEVEVHPAAWLGVTEPTWQHSCLFIM